MKAAIRFTTSPDRSQCSDLTPKLGARRMGMINSAGCAISRLCCEKACPERSRMGGFFLQGPVSQTAKDPRLENRETWGTLMFSIEHRNTAEREAVGTDLSTESLGSAGFRSRGFFFSILRRRSGFERAEKSLRDAGYFIDCRQKRGFICLRRFVEAADFSHELERSRSNLFVSDRRIEVEKGFDVSAHGRELID